jgi:site-specific recombinase XerC
MRLHNPENERIKRRYFTYLKEAKRYSEATVDRVAKSLSRFEEYTRSRGFKNFRVEQAVAFKRHFADQVSKRSGERLSKATLYATLTDLRNFFHWLAGQTGFRSRLGYADADYFNLSEKDSRIARAQREQPAPTLDQILHAIRSMPASTEIDRRDRAVVAFTILSGARDGAIASMTTRRFACARASRSDCVAVWNEYRWMFNYKRGNDVIAFTLDWKQTHATLNFRKATWLE